MSDRRDRIVRGVPPGGAIGGQNGSAARPLLWLFGGLVAAALLGVLVAPELLTDLRVAAEIALLVVAAGIPGLIALLVIAARRRGRDPDDVHEEA